MKKVLIISYYFPPVSNIAAHLSQGIAKNMPKFGWEPFIITTESKGNLPVLISEKNIMRFGLHCDSGKKLVSEEGTKGIPKIIKLPYILSKKLGIEIVSIDRFLFSWGKEVLNNIEAIKKINPDVIIATCYPPSGVWLGNIVSKKIKKPWVADFRDPMSFYNSSKFPFAKFLDGIIDKAIVKTASFVITVGPSLAEKLGAFYKKPSYVIYNGFDNQKIDIHRKKIGDKKIIYYAGRLHAHRIPAVKLLIDWLAQEKNNNIILKLRSIGPTESNEEIIKYATEKNALSKIFLLEPSSPNIIREEEYQADILVLFEDIGNLGEYASCTMTGKLFEYLPLKPPILAIARKKSDIETIIKSTSRGCLVSDFDGLSVAMNNILKDSLPSPNLEEVKKYSFEQQAKKICQLLNEIK
jgi:hypothetical protein